MSCSRRDAPWLTHCPGPCLRLLLGNQSKTSTTLAPIGPSIRPTKQQWLSARRRQTKPPASLFRTSVMKTSTAITATPTEDAKPSQEGARLARTGVPRGITMNNMEPSVTTTAEVQIGQKISDPYGALMTNSRFAIVIHSRLWRPSVHGRSERNINSTVVMLMKPIFKMDMKKEFQNQTSVTECAIKPQIAFLESTTQKMKLVYSKIHCVSHSGQSHQAKNYFNP